MNKILLEDSCTFFIKVDFMLALVKYDCVMWYNLQTNKLSKGCMIDMTNWMQGHRSNENNSI